MSGKVNKPRIIEALRESGPMTKQEIADYTGLPFSKVASCIDSARYLYPGKIFRIVEFRPQVGVFGIPIAVFTHAGGPDAPKLQRTDAERKKINDARYREKNRASINAYHRARRSRIAGVAPTMNPWLQLAAPSSRAGMLAAQNSRKTNDL